MHVHACEKCLLYKGFKEQLTAATPATLSVKKRERGTHEANERLMGDEVGEEVD